MTNTLADKLSMPHLADLKAEVERDATPQEDRGKRLKDPRMLREYTFDLKHEVPSGRVYEGAFTNKILSIGERSRRGLLQARLGGGLADSVLDPLTQEINLMLAHLEFSLTERPDWAKDLENLTDTELLYKIYEEVMAHEAIFCGRGPTPGNGADEG